MRRSAFGVAFGGALVICGASLFLLVEPPVGSRAVLLCFAPAIAWTVLVLVLLLCVRRRFPP